MVTPSQWQMNGKTLYFGWWVVAATMIGLLFGYGTFVGMTFGLFIKPLETEFGWSRTQISFGLTVCQLLIIIMAPGYGILMDRVGVRRLLLPGIVAFGLTLGAMALLTSSIVHFYLMYILIPIAGICTIPMTYTRVIMNWFDAKRGLALGIALSGVGLGAVILPPLLQHLISEYGWRSAYIVMGGLVLMISLPVNILLIRERPEEPELNQTGSTDSENSTAHRSGEEIAGLTVRDAFHDRAFWILFFVFGLVGVVSIGPTTHLFAMMTDRGISAHEAARIFSFLGIALILGRIACGYLVDRYFAPYVAFIFLSGMALGIAILGLFTSWGATMMGAILLGLGLGAEFDLMSYLVSRYLGLRSYGQLYGYLYAAFGLGAGTGPVLMGWLFDELGNYTLGLALLSVLGFILAILASRLGPYREFNIAGQ